MLQLKSLKQKVALLIILPLCMVMLLAGLIGMRLISRVLLDQWEETAISKMERSAHQVDMRLMRPKEILNYFQQNRQNKLNQKDIELLLDQLKTVDGVIDVQYTPAPAIDNGTRSMMRMHGVQNITISSLSYNTKTKSQTVSFIAKLVDTTGKFESYIEVVVGFYDLVEQIVKAPWWSGNKAFILDQDGVILASTELGGTSLSNPALARNLFKESGVIEAETWQAIQGKRSGTVFSPGIPPAQVSGFYRLNEAPWTLVVLAAGSNVLQPIITFRTYYFLISGVGILFVALYLWFITSRATRSINQISTAATRLSQGTFAPPLVVRSKDEIGNLTRSFNVMSNQLEERLQLKQEMSLAGEVQNNLLPQVDFTAQGLEVALLSKYCDDTGGDYVDILNGSQEKKRVTVVVGDVVGHGIGAALLMTTLRALLRCRVSMPGKHKEVIRDVNRLLCDDTIRFGNFATLFYLTVDSSLKTLTWVRCGHDPAMVFYPDTHSFAELKGEGLAMGLDKDVEFSQNESNYGEENQVILLGTDGIWEVENHKGECFGKERTKQLLAKYSHLSAREIADKILEEVENFSRSQKQSDDITLAIIKTKVHD